MEASSGVGAEGCGSGEQTADELAEAERGGRGRRTSGQRAVKVLARGDTAALIQTSLDVCRLNNVAARQSQRRRG